MNLHILLHKTQLPQANALLADMTIFEEQVRAFFVTEALSTRQPPHRLAVAVALEEMGLEFELEALLMDAGGYRVDMLLTDGRTVISIEQASDYVRDGEHWRPSGSLLLQQRQLRAFGYRVVSVPFYEWKGLQSAQQQRTYLWHRVGSEGGMGPAAAEEAISSDERGWVGDSPGGEGRVAGDEGAESMEPVSVANIMDQMGNVGRRRITKIRKSTAVVPGSETSTSIVRATRYEVS